ncbi:MAG: winged helix-turn-helix domain-containing protein [Planctomycetes bacterium]|nr:winged helix-turn-helix domain-containing protein [Planctomycetota bacterium]
MAAKKTTSKKNAKNNIKTVERPVTKAEKAKASKPLKIAKPKKTSALDAAAIVLQKAGKPMRAMELIAAMAEQKLWTSPGGKTPHATLYAAMLREISEKKADARFKKVDRGQFEFRK